MTEQEMPGWQISLQTQKNKKKKRDKPRVQLCLEEENEELEVEIIWIEEGASAPSSPPPPNLQAKMPNGEEPWWKVERGGRWMMIDPRDDAGAKRIPAGAKSSSEPSTLTPKLTETQEGAKPLHVPGHQPSKMEEQPTYIINTETKLGTIQDHPKIMPATPQG